MNVNHLIDNCFTDEDIDVLQKELKKDRHAIQIQYCKTLLKLESQHHETKSYEWYKEQVKTQVKQYFMSRK
jgi:hypothetical protein